MTLSGGEPTLHPESRACSPSSPRVPSYASCSTPTASGSRDEALADVLAEHRERVEVYLQYDGTSAESSRHHRGGDLRALKAEALGRLSEREVFTTLTMTAALGVNDGESARCCGWRWRRRTSVACRSSRCSAPGGPRRSIRSTG